MNRGDTTFTTIYNSHLHIFQHIGLNNISNCLVTVFLFNLLQGEGFKELLEFLEPGYQIPCRRVYCHERDWKGSQGTKIVP